MKVVAGTCNNLKLLFQAVASGQTSEAQRISISFPKPHEWPVGEHEQDDKAVHDNRER